GAEPNGQPADGSALADRNRVGQGAGFVAALGGDLVDARHYFDGKAAAFARLNRRDVVIADEVNGCARGGASIAGDHEAFNDPGRAQLEDELVWEWKAHCVRGPPREAGRPSPRAVVCPCKTLEPKAAPRVARRELLFLFGHIW